MRTILLGISSRIILDFQFEIKFEKREVPKFLKNVFFVFCLFVYLYIYLFIYLFIWVYWEPCNLQHRLFEQFFSVTSRFY